LTCAPSPDAVVAPEEPPSADGGFSVHTGV
jgi:hypothetical protein